MMLETFARLKGSSIRASDDNIGAVTDFRFTDLSWTVPYVVVDTGSWLSRRSVLLSTSVVRQRDTEAGVLLAGSLTRSQIENAPGVDIVQPVSRQYEEALANHYSWPMYWLEQLAGRSRQSLAEAAAAAPASNGNPHLRSCREVAGYCIDAADGEIGSVADFVIDTTEWELRYLVVDTGQWWPGKMTLIAPDWFTGMDWSKQRVTTELSRSVLKSCPEYDPSVQIDHNYETSLRLSLGRPEHGR